MENRTKFNLKESLEVWKLELSKNSNMTRDNINELESHLQDEIHDLQKLGLSVEESVLIAKNRIGSVEALATEFGKVNKRLHFINKIVPYLKGVLLYFACLTTINLLVSLSIITANKMGVKDENLNFVSIGLLILSTLSLVLFFYKKYKIGVFNMGKLTNIPVLITVIIVAELFRYPSFYILTTSIELSIYADMMVILSAFKSLFLLFVLLVSCALFYSLKIKSKIKIIE